MKLSDAKRILSGELVRDRFAKLYLRKRGMDLEHHGLEAQVEVTFTKADIDFMLRHLAEKVVRENGK